MSAPLVSIIVPTRDRMPLLARALASLQAQTLPDFEAVIVDNGSDDTAPVVATTVARLNDPRFRVLRASAVRNAAAARNVGLDTAAGTWVTFLDDDDAFRADKLARQLALAQSAGAPFVLCGARFHLRGRRRVRHCERHRIGGDALLNSAGLGTPFFFHRRAPALRFDASLEAGEDFHYGQRLLAGFDLREVPVVAEPLVDVYQDGAARSRTNLHAAAGWRAARRVWWEFGPRYSPAARRLFAARARVTHAKLRSEPRAVLRRLPALLRAGGLAEWRFAANALVVGAGWLPGRWVT